nr:unnamed protein product [Digitaria exilis]
MMDHVTPQIYATGINNPSGCSFDSDSSSRLFCADVNEVVHLLKEGAIGYDGGSNMSSSNATTTVASVVNRGRPKEGVGGIVYRRRSPLRVGCSKKSPLPCGGGIVGGRVLSMGEDNSNDALFLTARGMFRVVAPGACAVPAADPQPPGTNYWVLFVLGFHMVFGQYLFWTFWSTATGAGEININFFSNVGSLLVINYNRREHQE